MNPQPLTVLMRYHEGRHVTKIQIIDFPLSISSCHVILLTQTNVIFACTALYHTEAIRHHFCQHIQVLACSLFKQQANSLNFNGYTSSINRH
jgi:hypothetical protein